ncbi:hypothetical protein [Devosia sp.]|uniref:hypothetical protein n=1 Tax=Devosia sp. TaxID=1871048 RepID=UPI003A926987
MAKSRDQFRSSDVTIWGMVALACWAVAVLGANLSAMLPESIKGALHASRMDGGSINQLRGRIATLEERAAQLRRENEQLTQRFSRSENLMADATKRIGALEIAVPDLVEAQNRLAATPPAPVPEPEVVAEQTEVAALDPEVEIDETATGSVDSEGREVFEVEGGSVAVVTRPLPLGDGELAVPPPLGDGFSTQLFGVAIGLPLARGEAEARWHDYQAVAGPMLEGLVAVAMPSDFGGINLVAGPLPDVVASAELCSRLDRIGIVCSVSPFEGTPVATVN